MFLQNYHRAWARPCWAGLLPLRLRRVWAGWLGRSRPVPVLGHAAVLGPLALAPYLPRRLIGSAYSAPSRATGPLAPVPRWAEVVDAGPFRL